MNRSSSEVALVQGVLRGEPRAIARAISLVESESERAGDILSGIYPATGKAYRIGITGPPGAGKSTLVDQMALLCRKKGHRVGILSVDPSSPFTGGALLGDRVRMSAALADGDVYMRSMATRGVLGGLAQTTMEAADILDAAGKDVIFIETVGVGQSELEVARAGDVTVVVLVPESGGAIQAMKAGLMEAADVLVVNKADRPGADQLEADLLDYIEILGARDVRNLASEASDETAQWVIPVVQTVATGGQGTEELYGAIMRYRTVLEQSNAWREKRLRQAESKIRELVTAHLARRIWGAPEHREALSGMARELVEGRLDPIQASARFIQKLFKPGGNTRG
ncbi:MAG: methylmalonyl Co-A mutase-associated GTPase MeaB [Candidatus Xenobia bacterium]